LSNSTINLITNTIINSHDRLLYRGIRGQRVCVNGAY
jgi:hypothetical protein